MSERSDKYRELLNKIYGQTVVDAFVEPSPSEGLEKKDPNNLNRFINKRNIQNGTGWAENEGCDKCSKDCENFSKRKMDFPGWLGKLDFSNENAKKIMLIGEDVGPSVETYINIAYSLGLDRIEEDGTVIKIRADGTERRDSDNLLWKRLKKIFPADIDGMNGLEWVTKNIYITDICKCGATELAESQPNTNREDFWHMCSKEYLIDEIKLVKPKVIIFQGSNAYNYVEKLSRRREDINFLINNLADRDVINERATFPRYGHIVLDGTQINFLKIYHTANTNNGSWTPNNLCLFKRLVGEKVMPLLGI